MCGLCSRDETRLTELIQEELSDAKDFVPSFEASSKDSLAGVSVDEIAGFLDHLRPVWVSAASTAAGTRDDDVFSVKTDADLRAAISHFARVFFERSTPVPVISRWDPEVTPMLLDAAARFGGGTGVLVWVFLPASDAYELASILAINDWSRGKIVQVSGHGATAARNAIAGRNVRAAVFLGGRDEVERDAQALSPQVPRYAVGGTGGAAASLLSHSGAAAGYAGRDPTFVNALEHPVSFIELAREIVSRIP